MKSFLKRKNLSTLVSFAPLIFFLLTLGFFSLVGSHALVAQIAFPSQDLPEDVTIDLPPNCEGYGYGWPYQVPLDPPEQEPEACDDSGSCIGNAYSLLCAGESYDDFMEEVINDDLMPNGYEPAISNPMFADHGYIVVPLSSQTENPAQQISDTFFPEFTVVEESSTDWPPPAPEPLLVKKGKFPSEFTFLISNVASSPIPVLPGWSRWLPKPGVRRVIRREVKVWLEATGAGFRITMKQLKAAHLTAAKAYDKIAARRLSAAISDPQMLEQIGPATKELIRSQIHLKMLRNVEDLAELGFTKTEADLLFQQCFESSFDLVNTLFP